MDATTKSTPATAPPLAPAYSHLLDLDTSVQLTPSLPIESKSALRTKQQTARTNANDIEQTAPLTGVTRAIQQSVRTAPSSCAPRCTTEWSSSAKKIADRCSMVAILLAAISLMLSFGVLMLSGPDDPHSKYFHMFHPDSSTTWLELVGGVSLFLLFVLGYYSIIMGCTESKSATLLNYMSAFTAAVLLLCHVTSNIDVGARSDLASTFAVQFNAFYCDVRSVRMCLERERETQLLVLRGNASDAVLTDWTRCQHLLTWGIDDTGGRTRTTLSQLRVKEGVNAIDTESLYQFIDDYSSAHTVDVWCDSVYSRNATLSDAEQRALPSPFASNPILFANYRDEPYERMRRTNWMLWLALGCLLIAIAALKIASSPAHH